MEHLGGNDDGVLDEFFGVFCPEGLHRLGDGAADAGGDLINEHLTCFWTHEVPFF